MLSVSAIPCFYGFKQLTLSETQPEAICKFLLGYSGFQISVDYVI